MPNPVQGLIFIHIPKCAGMTLKSIVEKTYGPENVCDPFDRVRFDALPITEVAKYHVFMGHREYGWHRKVPHQTYYATMLRRPIERAISNWWYIRNSRSHFAHEAACASADALDFHRTGADLYADNGMTRMFADISDPYTLPYGEVAEVMFTRARDNLCKCAVVGLQSEFHMSLALYRRAFDWPVPVYALWSNRKVDRPPVDSLIDDRRQELERLEDFDGRLYVVGVGLFQMAVLREERSESLPIYKEARLLETLHKWALKYKNRWIGKVKAEGVVNDIVRIADLVLEAAHVGGEDVGEVGEYVRYVNGG